MNILKSPARQLSGTTLFQLAVASMVGTGVFTGSGYLLDAVPSAPAVLVAWLIGGFVSWCGSLAYGELCAALPKNGGEFALLSRIYHPRIGIAAGVVSIVAGFGGALAAVALGVGEYAARAMGLSESTAILIALISLLSAALLHTRSVALGARGQNVVTTVKIALCGALALALLLAGDVSHLARSDMPTLDAMMRPAFATGLVYIAYAYTGWNAAAYVAGEAKDPARIPRTLGSATLLVSTLYLALNAAFLVSAPLDTLAGQTEIAFTATVATYGQRAARAVSAIVALGLLSTLGAMLMTGARVLEAMSSERIEWLRRRGPEASPVRAVIALTALTLPLIAFSNVGVLLLYAGSALTLSALLTAAGVFVLRRREPDLERPYQTWGHPFTTGAYVLFAAWMLTFAVLDSPIPSICALLTAAIPAVLYRRGAAAPRIATKSAPRPR